MTFQEIQRAGYELTEKELFKQASSMISTYKTGRDKVLEVIQKNYGKYLTDVNPADYYTVLNQYQRLTKMNKEIQGLYIKTSVQVGSDMKNTQQLAFGNNFYRQQYSTTLATSTIGERVAFTQVSPAAMQASVFGDLTLWSGIRDEAVKKQVASLIPASGTTLTSLLVDNRKKELIALQREIKSALINGEGYKKTAIRIKGIFNNSASNTMRVLRTEGNRNMNSGALWNTEEMRNQDVKIQRQWVATLDGNTRETHQSADGQIENKSGLFHVGGSTGRYPGDLGDPAEDINCRCSTIDIVDEIPPTIRRAVDPVTGKSDIIDYKNYDQYMKDNGMRQDRGKWVKSA